MSKSPKDIAIVGSGLVGSLLAIYLRKEGHKVTVFDRRPDIRTVEFSGRSINLAMSNRGWNALQQVGLEKEIKEIAIPLYQRAMHVDGVPLYYQKYGKEEEAIWSTSRGILNRKMIDLAEAEGTEFRFSEKVWDVDLPEAKIFTGESEKGVWEEYKFDCVFGCDGAFSRVRHKMQRRSRFDYSQEFIKVGYKELSILPNEDGTHKLDKHSFHIWPRGKFMLIAMPNLDGSFTCTLFMPYEGDISFESIKTKEDARTFFSTHFPNVMPDLDNLIEDFFKNPTSAMVTMKCFPWTYWDKAALVGDSAHAIVPFYGQGMNAGFEDIFVLTNLLKKYPENWTLAFNEYQKERKPNADAIAELSYRNFVEMSSKTADPMFLLQKKIEKKFATEYPEKWLPVYSRVTFSNRPYAEALALGDEQEAIMKKVMQLPNIKEKWDSDEVTNKIIELLK
ncbi:MULTISPECIES: FAD-dependent oxidoreductase [unclassified Cellulophaga]|uniref:FAD-dependent oxidoreductase n=1 Tax=unclassified Cellulophaga TaxID=2634405 RepID=UPI000C2BA2D0|nr:MULTISPECIES: NAD(P)/FAD-dependent oxidoreductase [unclassified Cellulophaga]MDO6492805.1 NAD(P)/FAD-dependent oxidoreductase [Cellulophaga sp. 2_MG-2023]MDO6496235.1 NAD(P)/FAD-dependent oxidoreductase [Cellulophaga sp. 3_MG-2023]PKB43374.1 kynurenine 3-monooxygenase [Cellulophaga sp. RHA19]